MKQKFKATLVERKALAMAAEIIGSNSTAAQCLKVVETPKGRVRFWWATRLGIFEQKFATAKTGGASSN
jgi:hypothetical protein